MASQQFGSLAGIRSNDLWKVAASCCDWLDQQKHPSDPDWLARLDAIHWAVEFTPEMFRKLFREVLMTPTEFECYQKRAVVWHILKDHPEIDREAFDRKADFDQHAMQLLSKYDPTIYEQFL